MYDKIVQYIEQGDWNNAIRELHFVLNHNEFDEELAVLAGTVFIGINNIVNARDVISSGLRINYKNYELWLLLGQSYEQSNVNQAYLCYENALFYCTDEDDRKIILEFIASAETSDGFCVRKTAIVILSYNSLHFTRKCIESIRKTCPPEAYELIVIDNASSDDSVSWLMEQSDLKLKCNSRNVGFPCGCNQGIKMAEADSDIFLLNNDTIMTDNALFWLRMGLYENEYVGATGAASNCVSDLQQVTWNCSSIEEFLNVARINNLPQKNPYMKRNWLIGFALMLKRSVLEKVGYLDERFTPGQYEDNDIGLRLGEAGYELLLCKNSFIFHYGSGGGEHIEKWSNLMLQNKIKIEEKWGFKFDEYIYTDLGLLSKIGNYGGKEIKVLHIGCGIGATLLTLKDGFPNAELYGAESNESMVKVSPRSIEVFHGNIFAEDVPFDKEFFDIVLCGKVYDDSSDQEGIVNRAMEYLKAGGHFITHTQDVKKEEDKMSEELPLVSVIMPCYNHAEYVGNVIESILNQTYSNIELIVADNGSTDNSFEVINQYRDRIKILRLEKNNRQLCIKMLCEAASGEYIAQATSDDEWMPEKIELQMEAFFADPNLQGCFAWALYADENLQVFPNQENNVFLVKNRSREGWLKKFIYEGNCLCYASALAKRDVFNYSINMYRGYVQLGDFYQWILFLQNGDIHVVEKPMVKFRWHVSGANRNDSAPSSETSIRTNQEYTEIVLQTLELVDDDLFRNTFKDEFVKYNAENHQEILCEKFLLLKRMSERTFLFSDVMMTFYHNHYSEMEHTLKTVYGFTFEDSSELFARSGFVFTLEQLNREKMLSGMQRMYISSYMDIAEMLSQEIYRDGFNENTACVVFSMMPEAEQSRLRDLYKLCVSVLRMLAGTGIMEKEVYFNLIKPVEKLCQLMSVLRKQTQMLGIMCDSEEFQLFEELVQLAVKNKIDLQEAIVPYIQIITGQLGEVIDRK